MDTNPSVMKDIPLSAIRENTAALRSVDRTNPAYLELVNSVARDGVQLPIVVREITDPATGEILYGLVDGLHRYNASLDAGKTTIPAKVTSASDADALTVQIITNTHRIETKPAELCKAFQRIMSLNPLMTRKDLADKIMKSEGYVGQILGLGKLSPEAQTLVDEGKINLVNAVALSKLPPPEQANFLVDAMTKPGAEFVGAVQARASELRTAAREGRAASDEYVPVAHLRKIAEIKGEVEAGAVASDLLTQTGTTDAVEAFKLGLEWALHLDPISVKLGKEKHDAKIKQRETEKAERQVKIAEERRKKAEQLEAEVKARLSGAPAPANG